MPLLNAATEPADWIPILTTPRRSDMRPFIKRSVIWFLPSTLVFHAFAFVANRHLIDTLKYNYRKSLRPETKQENKDYNHRPDIKAKRTAAQNAMLADPEKRAVHNQRCMRSYFKKPEKWHARNKEWLAKNQEKMRLWFAGYVRDKRRTDPQYRMRNRICSRLRHAIRSQRGDKCASTIELLGCTLEQFRIHLEAQFKPGMTWETIHIDHITPCAFYDLTKPDEQRQCFHFSNLQPLFAADNISKGDRMSA